MKITLVVTSVVMLMIAFAAANVLPPRHEATYPKPYDITRK